MTPQQGPSGCMDPCRVLFERMLLGCAVCRIVCMDGRPVDWIYQDVNPAFTKLTGLHDVVGRRVSEVLLSLLKTSPEVLTSYGEVALNNVTKHFEVFLKPMGIWVNVHAFSPEPEVFIVTLEDITATKEAEAALKWQERHYRLITENVSDEIWTMNLEGRFTYISPSVERLRGCTQAEALTQRLDEILGPEDLALAQATFHAAAEAAVAGQPMPEFHTEWEEFRKDRTKIWTEVRANELRDEEGRVIGYLGVTRDISERKASEFRFRKVFTAVEQNSTSIVITDSAGIIEYINPRFTEVSGYTSDEVVGKYPRILKSDRHPPGTYKELWSTITAGLVWKGELCNRKKCGEYHWENVIVSPIKDDRGTITNFVAIKEDITDRRLAQEERERLIQELTRMVAEVRQLSGLLPICAHCKKIRDDRGYWNQIEGYISSRTAAQFSHGICPDCVQEHYPGRR